MTGRAARLAPFAAAVLALAAVSAGGIVLTDLGPWYAGLRKPSWQPPDAAFGPVWTTIYALCAVAFERAWSRAPQGAARWRILAFCAANLLLNLLWSAIFFTARRPDLALVEVVPFWISIALLAREFARHARLAGWLLAPYLAWVAFAAFLNLTIVRLNPS